MTASWATWPGCCRWSMAVVMASSFEQLEMVTNESSSYPPLSALNYYLFCPRRCALHRLEGVWVENVHTAAGSIDHRRVHQPRDAVEGPVRTVRGLRIVSHRLRVVGATDLVEFHPAANGSHEIPYP